MITLIGNCQLHRMQYVLDRNDVGEYQYFATSDRIDGDYDPHRALLEATKSGVIIAQAVSNPEHPLYYKNVQAISDNVLFVPYVFVDGVFSVSGAGPLGTYYYGQSYLLDWLRKKGHYETIRAFMHGELDFDVAGRLSASLDELVRREKECCHVRISDYIQSEYQETRLFTTHNHPTSHLFDVFCRRVFREADIRYRPYDSISHDKRVVYAFSRTPRIFSPYDVEELGLRFGHDEQWFENGCQIIDSLVPQVEGLAA